LLAPLWDRVIKRIPELSTCKTPEIVNSPDNFTPDGRWILGETAEVTNYFVACGMNGNSLQVLNIKISFINTISSFIRELEE
jgi:pyruvate dehydrogenase phosphatase regulatory subunit